MNPAPNPDHNEGIRRRIFRRRGAALGLATVLLALAGGVGCRPSVPDEFLVLTQTPRAVPAAFSPKDTLDLLYPPGSRIVLVTPGSDGMRATVLSASLHAAGGAVVAPSGDRVLFSGKATPKSEWQIFECPLRRALPVARTAMPGGAMGPIYLPDGRIGFSSPVPLPGHDLSGPGRPELYAQRPGEAKTRRLTFGLAGALEATVLRDGRILFVSGGSAYAAITNQSLFTINSDGTEITAFAAQHDGRVRIRRPRESPEGRVVFLSSDLSAAGLEGRLEQVLAARPFSSREAITATDAARFRAAEPAGDDRILVTAEGFNEGDSFGVYALDPKEHARSAFECIFDDPEWHEVEVAVRPPGSKPMGRLSTVDESMSIGRLLCLDVNHFGDLPRPEGATAKSVRFLSPTPEGAIEWLGEVPVQVDGSFLVEIPANTLLGLETLDEAGRVIRRLPPSFWVRPGENRSCVGCHEPHSSCPENRRPLAVKVPALKVGASPADLAQRPGVTQ